MSRRPRRNHSPAFKAKLALSGIKGEKALAMLEVRKNRDFRGGAAGQTQR